MTPQDRIEQMIASYQRLVPDQKVDQHTLIRGTSIEKLCEFVGPGYIRVRDWIDGKIKQLPPIVPAVDDMELARAQYQACFELMKSRNAKYGDSWKRLTNSSIVDLMIMKLDRCQKQSLDDRALEVEIEDVVNYGIFALINLRNK